MVKKIGTVLARSIALQLVLLLIISSVTTVFLAKPASAANFSMKSGQYVGTGVGSRAITGLGFQPSLVLIKSSTTAGVAVFKSSAMPTNNIAFMSATADNTATQLTFTSDGFTLGTLANVNTANVVYYWTAFTGSDCSATGNFCVGTFTGNGTATRTITTGFQPSVVIVKRSTAVAAHFRTASMAANRTEYFTSTAADTTGNFLRSMAATSFDVGATDNVSSAVYYYVAFKSGSSMVAEGTYTGNGAVRSITGTGFTPSFVLVKNSTSATTNSRRSVMATAQNFGDLASYVGDAVADTTTFIQLMQSDGFQVGTGVGANENAITIYWFALGGAPGPPAASGDFTMDQGSYTGTGASFSVTGLDFAPDLVLIKDNSTNYAVYRIKDMAGDTTAYLGNGAVDFAGGVTSMNSDGFTIGTSTVVNTAAGTYHWQAFGNAYRADKGTGASDFAIGTYYGSGLDTRNISVLPFQPDFVAMKRNSTTAGVFRTTDYAADSTGMFSVAADTANIIETFNSDGFRTGTHVAANAAGSLYRWFAFKDSANFITGAYTGNATDNRAITSVGFNPNLVWIKRSTAVGGVIKPSTLAGDNTQYFMNTASAAGRVKTLTSTGFTLGTQTEVNANTGVYKYVAWRVPVTGALTTDIVDASGVSVGSPSLTFTPIGYLFDCSENTTTLGISAQKIRVSNTTGNPSWSTSIAATDGATALWRNGGNTQQFDFNDINGTPNGCTDGGDSDSRAGKLQLEFAGGTITPQGGCTNTGVSLGSDSNFNEGTTNAVTLMSASAGALTGCYWDLTGVNLRQTIPATQPADSYNLNLTITTVAI